MNKAPAFQFYVADYMQDTRCLSLAAKGAWTDCLCAMWRSRNRGEITYPLIGFARLFGCTVEQANAVIDELVEMNICDRVTHDDGKMTLTNRRMQREAKEREAANNRQKNYVTRKKQQNSKTNDGGDDGKMTSYSSSSSSTSEENNNGGGGSTRAPTRENGKPPPTAADSPKFETLQDYLLRKQIEFPEHDVPRIHTDFVKKCGSDKYPNLKNTRRHFDRWLEEQDVEFKAEQTVNWQKKVDDCPRCDKRGLIKTKKGMQKCSHEK